MTKILAIESSTMRASVALLSDNQVLEHRESEVNNHSELILPLIDECLQAHKLSLADLEHIAIGVGPGSFTGLRIGMASAKGLCFAANLPLVGVSSLLATAHSCLLANPELVERGTLIAPILDARRGEVFLSAYLPTDPGSWLQSQSEEMVLAPEDAVAKLHELAGKDLEGLVVCGNGLARFESELGSLPTAPKSSSPTPSAVSVAMLSAAAARTKEADSANVATLAPSYVRLPEAVIKFPDGNTGGTFSQDKLKVPSSKPQS